MCSSAFFTVDQGLSPFEKASAFPVVTYSLRKTRWDKKIEGEAMQSSSLDKRKKVGLVEKLLGTDQP